MKENFKDYQNVAKEYVSAVNIGDVEGACKIVDWVADRIIEKEEDLATARGVVYSMLGILCTAVITQNLPARILREPEFVVKLNELEEYATETDIANFVQVYIKGITEIVCNDLGKRRSTIQLMKSYIDKHFCEYEFCVASVADQFNMTIPAVCQYFKSKTGTTITDFVWNRRLETATRLLVETNVSIKDIVARVGYIDSSSFARKFKESMGVSPIEYRRRAYLF